ncbi:hypothetical protein MASR1M32_24590 [Rhodobacter sp.]
MPRHCPVKDEAMLLHAASALLPDGWASDVLVRVEAGRIVEVTPGAAPQGEGLPVLLPAPVNLHSHTFQRAMAGMTEYRSAGQDSFWTWRSLMYRFLDHLNPDEVQAIAAMAMIEMAEAGYAAVAEFHYLHHGPGGVAYANRAEMSLRIIAAAAETGLGLTHLPVAYMQGGCDGRALAGGQKRFENDLNSLSDILQKSDEALKRLAPDARLGVAPHSLRAVPWAALAEMPALAAGGPVHIHIAEQLAEVEEVSAAYGARPVEWVVANLPLSPHWCMIHATQMTPAETAALAATGAVAGLCPETEANLGDGIFDGAGWAAAGGASGSAPTAISASRWRARRGCWNTRSALAGRRGPCWRPGRNPPDGDSGRGCRGRRPGRGARGRGDPHWSLGRPDGAGHRPAGAGGPGGR